MSKQLIVKGILAGANLAYHAYRAARSTSVLPMAPLARRYASKRTVLRRRPNVSRNIPRMIQPAYVSMRRTSQAFKVNLSAGVFFGSSDIVMNSFYLTDLIGNYDVYRLKSLTVEVLPSVDPGNSGVTNNQCLHVYTACDTIGAVATPTAGLITSYQNYKYGSIPSGSKFLYKFYPKVTNTVDNAGVATPVGSYGTNPWLSLNTAGIAIPHHRLLYGLTTGSTSTQEVTFTFTVQFDVKRMR